jgi:hypothetical protein
MVRSSLWYQHLSMGYWAEATVYSAYVLNRTPPPFNPNFTRYELLLGKKPRIDNIRTFGCPVYARQYDETTSKWDPRAWKGHFIGLSEDSPRAWKVWNPSTRQAIYTSSVVFDESIPSKEGKESFLRAAEAEGLDRLFQDSLVTQPTRAVHDPNTSDDLVDEVDSDTRSYDIRRSDRLNKRKLTAQAPRRSIRIKNSASIAIEDDQVLTTEDNDILSCRCYSATERKVPTTYQESISGTDAGNWITANQLEIDSICKAECLEIIECPIGVTVLPYKWVFKIKETVDGFIERYKTRLTIGGHRQKYGRDYTETFSPVVRYSTVRMLLAVAAAHNLHLHQMDVDTAFLYGKLPESEGSIYMKIPEGYPIPEALRDKENLVAKVKKSLYGLKQAPRLWNKTLDDNLIAMGFRKSDIDPCIYSRGNDSNILYVAVYVDDLIIAGADIAEIETFKIEISRRFNMKDLGELEYFLGIRVTRSEGGITLSQDKYASDILKRFGMSECRPKHSPLDPGTYLHLNDNIVSKVEYDTISTKAKSDLYREIVGSLMYLMIGTRPDLAYAVGYLSRYLSNHNRSHMNAALHVLRYLKYTSTIGISYSNTATLELTGYSDSDWASDLDTRRSTPGYLFKLAGGPISW